MQEHLSLQTKYSAPGNKIFVPSPYLANLTFPTFKKASALAQFNVLLSVFLEERYHRVPYQGLLFSCDSGDVGSDVGHILFHCSFYQDFHQDF